MKNFLLFLILFFAYGCATTARYETRLNAWIGASEEQLISAWGVPDMVYVLDNGKKAIAYVRKNVYQSGGYSYSVPRHTYYAGRIGNETFSGTSTQYTTETVPQHTHKLYCKTSFIIDNTGKIISWHYEGNNCVAP